MYNGGNSPSLRTHRHLIEEWKVGDTMPRWMLHCEQCSKAFPYSEVTFEHPAADAFAWLGSKPNFPQGGISLECPNCKETSVYQHRQLIYSVN